VPTPTGLPPRGGTSGAPAAPPDETTLALREEVVELARSLPGELRRLTVRSGDREIEVEWAADPRPAAPPATAAAATEPAGGAGTPVAADGLPDDVTAVRAPLVGTFYAAPSPGADPFVRVGDEVEAGQTLAIVEAMKLMNPVVADAPGIVREVLVADAESVEYEQVLLLLDPAGGPR
jgi:acetyl-CoA carboxylase biotin carboxyl carrier protein